MIFDHSGPISSEDQYLGFSSLLHPRTSMLIPSSLLDHGGPILHLWTGVLAFFTPPSADPYPAVFPTVWPGWTRNYAFSPLLGQGRPTATRPPLRALTSTTTRPLPTTIPHLGNLMLRFLPSLTSDLLRPTVRMANRMAELEDWETA
ncbi:hypothetical protein Y032_0523g2917 [Ancylostoma ceylanicum]|uniref:Uncharacterized protein n=1 Tax=Ancylostoma ceylanicum TaxID=53326 RepID=A0A016WSQ9_9BILA|nr:hypothetical protein Y032_0523g2917 [Ancylostoma ceylanicum]